MAVNSLSGGRIVASRAVFDARGEINPFIILLVQRGIEVAAEALANGFDLREDPARFGHIGLR